MKDTGILSSDGIMIKDGDWVSLDGNMTADDSMGADPNGWIFDEDDVYQVYFDERVKNWSLRLGIEPDTPYNVKYMNHAISLLYDGDVKIVDEPITKDADE